MQELSSVRCFGGWQRRYSHESVATGCTMNFSVFLPPQADGARVPTLLWLSGLTCSDLNAVEKAGAQRVAARLGLALLFPDTSPRGLNVAGEAESWDLGVGAGFYLDATQAPWSTDGKGWRMESYILELLALAKTHLPLDGRVGVAGHSMGGHGALTLGLRHPELFGSVSAFAPICNPAAVPWGRKAFAAYLGPDESAWAAHDACALVRAYTGEKRVLLVDQGTSDKWLAEQLTPERLVEAAATSGSERVEVQLRMRDGYDHSYCFIATFIEEHLEWHAAALCK
jgi:S-formylglutathione hydrolase